MKNKEFIYKKGMYYKYIGDDCEEWSVGSYYKHVGNLKFEGSLGLIYQLDWEWSEDVPAQGYFDFESERSNHFPDICSSHNPSTLSYGLEHERAEAKMKNGEFQKQCDLCRRWLFDDEFQ